MQDTQLTHHLYHLNNALNDQFKDKEYKDIIDITLDNDVTSEVDALVQYIKLNY